MEKNLKRIHIIMSTTEVSRLQVASLLTEKLIKNEESVIEKELNLPISVLLDMIEGRRDFNRRVLRYLGLKKVIKYFYKDSDHVSGEIKECYCEDRGLVR